MNTTDTTQSNDTVATLCQQRLGIDRTLSGCIKRIRDNPPGPDRLYYEYYASQVMFHRGGDDWRFWNLGPDGDGVGGMRERLINRQHTGTESQAGQRGSWDGYKDVGGRIGATSMSLLTLQIYYRYPRLIGQRGGSP